MQCLLHTFLLSVFNSVICLKVIGVLIHQGMFLFIFILILIIVIILYLFRCEDEISFLIFVHVQFHWAGFQKEVDPLRMAQLLLTRRDQGRNGSQCNVLYLFTCLSSFNLLFVVFLSSLIQTSIQLHFNFTLYSINCLDIYQTPPFQLFNSSNSLSFISSHGSWHTHSPIHFHLILFVNILHC